MLATSGYLRTSPEIDAAYARSKVTVGDLVIAIRASVGKSLIVPPELDGANLTQGTARLSPGEKIDRSFAAHALNSSGAQQEFTRISKGATFREITLEMLRKFRIPCPPRAEQVQLVEWMSLKASGFDHAIADSEQSIRLLTERRAALISAAVTGKIDVRKANNEDVRNAVATEIILLHAHKPTFGRVKNQKLVFLAEAHVGVWEIAGRYEREAAGPLDRRLIHNIESSLTRDGHLAVQQDGGPTSRVVYRIEPGAKRDRQRLSAMLGDRLARLDHLNEVMADLDTLSSEAIATLYAVWNDALLDGESVDDERLIRGVLDEWHPEKKRKFTPAKLKHWLDWMRRHEIVPTGRGSHTIATQLLV